MNRIITVFIFSICFFFSNAQVSNPSSYNLSKDTVGLSKDTVGVYSKVEVEAQFTGGNEAWKSYLEKNIDWENVSKKVKFPRKQKEFKQTAIVKFIVCTDGSLCNIEIENSVHPLIKKEAERAIKESPNWVPATQNNKIVKAYRRQPITFLIVRD